MIAEPECYRPGLRVARFPGWCSWSLPVGRAVRGCGDVARPSGIAKQAVAFGRSRDGQNHGRTGWRRGAKPQSTGNDLADFYQEPSGRGVMLLAGKGQPGEQPPSARRARMHTRCRLALGGQGNRRG
ncbi:MAG TPA: hypothetical protein PKV33_05570 [Methanothrix sp.]|nr:hypothetical protein [Methanothrix sp.]